MPVRFVWIALAVCALCNGCHWFRLPKIDPSGERIFLREPHAHQPHAHQPHVPQPQAPILRPPAFVEQPGPPRPHHHARGVAVMPCKIIAPVGSEVVMLAAVAGLNGQPKANQRVEWMLAPGGAGQIVALGKHTPLDWLVGFRTWPRKIDNTFAIGSTSSRNLCLTRGTPSPADDVPVLRGQAWLSVTSPIEGTSYVTAYAPGVYGWDSRQQTATIHWVDAQWSLPPPAVQTVGGRHVLTTTVLRHSTQAPAEGYRVRYQIVSGPAAGFAPQGAQMVEVATNALGQAAVELFQTEPAAGTNVVAIEITRPPGAPGDQSLVLGSGSTQISWSSPVAAPSAPPAAAGPAAAPAPGPAAPAPVLEARMTGPQRAVIGQEVTFEVVVTNRGATAASGLVIVDRYPPGLRHAQRGNSIERVLGDLAPGASRSVAVTFRVAEAGRLCNRAEIHSPLGVLARAEACLTAERAAQADPDEQPRLSVRKTGPDRRRVGETAEFLIEITNNGRQPATELKVLDHYDQDALDPVSATDGYSWTGLDLVWNVDVLPPGKTIVFQVHCRCLRPAARSCNGATVTSREQARADGEACLEIAPAAAGGSSLSISVADVRDPVAVGNQTTYEVRVTNNSQAADRQVAVAVTVPSGMTALVVGSSGPAAYRVEGRQVRFDPVREIRPGETLSYRVEARAERAGGGRCQVEVTSERIQQPRTAETTTTIVSGP
ncbi:MAG: DUF11 domain-containing protein [Pirellulales bacterium]